MAKQATQMDPEVAPTRWIFVQPEKLFDQMLVITQAVAARAYDFFESRGGATGHELEDWFRAERELLRPVPVEITQTDTHLNVRAEVPGFTAAEIKVSVEPHRLIISGDTATTERMEMEKTVYTDRSPNRFFRSVDLPAEVGTAARATLKDGILALTLSKAAPNKPPEVEVQIQPTPTEAVVSRSQTTRTKRRAQSNGKKLTLRDGV